MNNFGNEESWEREERKKAWEEFRREKHGKFWEQILRLAKEKNVYQHIRDFDVAHALGAIEIDFHKATIEVKNWEELLRLKILHDKVGLSTKNGKILENLRKKNCVNCFIEFGKNEGNTLEELPYRYPSLQNYNGVECSTHEQGKNS